MSGDALTGTSTGMNEEFADCVVLIVGGSPANGAITGALRAAGLTVVEVDNPAECWSLIATRAPELVLHALPEQDAIALCRRLRHMSDGPAIGRIVEASHPGDGPAYQSADEVDVLVPASAAPAVLLAHVRAAVRLRRAQAQLRRFERDKQELLALLAHELRGPLAPLHMSLHLLKRITPDEARAQSALDIMQRQVAQMARLVDDFMDISRYQRGKLAVQLQPLNLAEVLAGAVEQSRPLMEASSQQVEVVVAEPHLHVAGDRARLLQALSQLLANSVELAGAGGTIKIDARRDAGDIVVTIADNGIGVAPDRLLHIFDLFTPGQARAPGGGGLAMGLALTHALITLHGGAIDAASAGSGLGSTFTVRLPAHDGPLVEALQSTDR